MAFGGSKQTAFGLTLRVPARRIDFVIRLNVSLELRFIYRMLDGFHDTNFLFIDIADRLETEALHNFRDENFQRHKVEVHTQHDRYRNH